MTLPLMLICRCLLCLPSAAADVPNGLYLQTDDPSAPVVIASSGREIHVGPAYTGSVREASLMSQDNGNTRFSLSLQVPYDEQVVAPYRTALVVDGQVYDQMSGGSSANEVSYLEFQISKQQRAETVARHLEIKPQLRQHPGYRLHITFTPVRSPASRGEAVPVVLRMTNLADHPIAFMQGGRNRAERDNQFVFSATFSGKQVEDIGTSLHFGGLAAQRRIDPGETFAATIDLRKWFALDTPGIYEVLGSYYMAFIDPEEDSWHTVWEAYATASFSVQIADD